MKEEVKKQVAIAVLREFATRCNAYGQPAADKAVLAIQEMEDGTRRSEAAVFRAKRAVAQFNTAKQLYTALGNILCEELGITLTDKEKGIGNAD